MRKALLAALLLLAACHAGPESERPPWAGRPTNIQRDTGQPWTREELALYREQGERIAHALMLLDREVGPALTESRDVSDILDAFEDQHPYAKRSLEASWREAEAPERARRGIFGELGIFPSRAPFAISAPGANPPSLRSHVLRELARRRAEPLAGPWARFAPEVASRRENYLASAWSFELDGLGNRGLLRDSLLGPFARTGVSISREPAAGGPWSSLDGFEGPVSLLESVQPGAPSPVLEIIDRLAPTEYVRLQLPEDERRFYDVALTGLRAGACDVAEVPRGCMRFEVLFSYLVADREARASLRLARKARGWVLERFTYEPASAELVGARGAALDLSPFVGTGGGSSAVVR